jgi:LysR family carnitine catabolism transcriptional activator
LPGVESAFRGAQPDVTITIEDALAAEVLQRVRTAEADVAVTVLGEGAAWGGDVETTDDEDEFVVTPVATDRFCLLAQPLTRFAEESEVAWDEIAGTPFVAFHATTSIRRHVDHAFSMIGARPEIVVTARNIAAVAGLVDAGLGVTAVPGLVVPLTGFADLVHVPLVDPVVERRIVAVHARARPPIPAAAAFLAALTGGSRPSLPTHARWVSW